MIIATSIITSQFWFKKKLGAFCTSTQCAANISVICCVGKKWYVEMASCTFLSKIKSDVSCCKLWNGTVMPLKEMRCWQYCPLAWRHSRFLLRLDIFVVSHRSHFFKMTWPSVADFAACNLKLLVCWLSHLCWRLHCGLGHYASGPRRICPLFLILKSVYCVFSLRSLRSLSRGLCQFAICIRQ